MMLDINKSWVDIPCPQCGYLEAVQMIDIKTEKLIFCHNCKTSIKLIDSEASVDVGIKKINQAFENLMNSFKKS